MKTCIVKVIIAAKGVHSNYQTLKRLPRPAALVRIWNPPKVFHSNGFDVQARHERTHPRITKTSSLWSPQPVQAADVILAISKLKITKSTGHDQINLQHVKKV